MMKTLNIKQYLNQPYSYYYGQRNLHRLSLILITFGFLFNYLFEPFVVYRPEHKINFLWICLVHSVLPTLIGYAFFTVVNLFKPQQNWTVGKEIIHLSAVFLLIGTGNFLIRDLIYDNPDNWSVRYLLEEISHTFLVGPLIMAILLSLKSGSRFRKNQLEVLPVPATEPPEVPAAEPHEAVFIQTQVKADDFHLNVADFLFARAAGNYVEIMQQPAGQSDKLLKRISIKDLEQQLSGFPWIIKTHRAYLVNTRRVTAVKGNAQGYQLSFDQYPEKAPVSRGMVAAFDEFMRQRQG